MSAPNESLHRSQPTAPSRIDLFNATIGDKPVRVELFREWKGYFIRLNGQRIRPCEDKDIRTDLDANRWFMGLVSMIVAASNRESVEN